MSDTAAGLRGAIAKLATLDDQGMPLDLHPIATPERLRLAALLDMDMRRADGDCTPGNLSTLIPAHGLQVATPALRTMVAEAIGADVPPGWTPTARPWPIPTNVARCRSLLRRWAAKQP